MDNTERNEFYGLNNAEAQQTYVRVRRAKDWGSAPIRLWRSCIVRL